MAQQNAPMYFGDPGGSGNLGLGGLLQPIISGSAKGPGGPLIDNNFFGPGGNAIGGPKLLPELIGGNDYIKSPGPGFNLPGPIFNTPGLQQPILQQVQINKIHEYVVDK